jgi:biopolymer transport protein ExbD
MPMRRPRHIPDFGEDAPISALNTTPLIDVLLVLMIMIILTLPTMSHKVPADLPQGPRVETAPPTIYRLDLAAGGGLLWNGIPIAGPSLPVRLAAVQADSTGELHLAADGAARYEDYDRLLAAIKRAGITRLGLVGNDAFVHDLDR